MALNEMIAETAAGGAVVEPVAKTIPQSQLADVEEPATAAAPAKAAPLAADLPADTLNERIARAKRSATAEVLAAEKQKRIELWGTDDEQKIRDQRAEHAKLLADAEAAKLAQMSEIDRANATKEAVAREAAEWKSKYEQTEQTRRRERQDAVARAEASKHVDALYVDEALAVFKNHLRTIGTAEAAKMGPEQADQWFADYVKGKPALAPVQAAAIVLPKTEPKKVPVTTGSAPNDIKPAPTGSNVATDKTPRPGQTNSMTKAEYSKHKQQLGFS